MTDWLLYTLVTPALLAFLVATNVDDPGRLAHIALFYVGGYAAWSVVGAVALRKWRLAVLFPALLVIDWIARVNLLHAAIKAIRRPTAECRWESPARYAAAA
jgi:poly-beta-1,6-N-acetyl-D-glucosamine synthase